MSQNPPETWLNITSLSLHMPSVRGCYGMAYDALDREVVLFGGCGVGTQTRNGLQSDTWTFAHGVWTRSTSPGPPAREYPTMTYDSADGYVLLFGGEANGTAFNDTWTFSGGHWTQLLLRSHPGARTQAMMTYDGSDQYVLLWGGYNTTTFSDMSDTWKFTGGGWSSISPQNGSKPTPRHLASMTYDTGDHEVILFGGLRQALIVTLNDTWSYLAGLWTKLSPVGPVPKAREQATLGYDGPSNRTLLVGGDTIVSVLADVWAFGNGSWTLLHRSPFPSARTGAGFVWDAADGYDLFFGGNASVPNGPVLPLSDSWSVGPNFTASLEPSHPTVDVRQSMLYFSRAVANGSATFSYLYSNLPPGCAGADQATLSCGPTSVGNFTASVNVTAAWGSTRNTSLASATLMVNSLPGITSLSVSPSMIDYNERFTLQLATSGGSGGDRYSYSGLPLSCLSFNVTMFNCTVNGGPVAGGYPHTFQINATVTDAVGGRNVSTVDLTVNADPSVAAGSLTPSPAATDVGFLTDFVSNATGGTGPLTYSYSGLPPGCAPANLSVLPCRPRANGTFTVNLTVTDSTGYSSSQATTQLTVNAPPQVTGLVVNPGAIDAGQMFTVVTLVSGGTGLLSYSSTGLPGGCPRTVAPSFSCTTRSTGNFTIEVTVTDSVDGSANLTAPITVRPDPTIASLDSNSAHVDWNQSFTVAAVTSGGTAPVSYTYSGEPKGCSGANSSTIVCATSPLTAIGLYTIVLKIQDGVGWTENATVRVEVNSDPMIRSFSVFPSMIAVGETTSLIVGLSGGSGSTGYVYSGLPSGCATNSTSNLQCSPSVAGEFNVSVNATDVANYTVSASARLLVEPAVPGTDGSGAASGLAGYALAGIALAAIVVAVAAILIVRRRRNPPDPPEDGTSGDPIGTEPTGPPFEQYGDYDLATSPGPESPGDYPGPPS